MQNKSANARYRIIDKCLRDKSRPYPTLEDLIEACSEGLNRMGLSGSVGRSTIQHDIQDLREGKAIIGKRVPIEYHKKEKGYYYYDKSFSLDSLQLDEEEWSALRYASSLLFQYKEVRLFSHFKSAIERIDNAFELGLVEEDEIEKIILFETATSTKGLHWIQDLYYAIKFSYSVEIKYENIYRKEKRRHRLTPYLLREYQNRWYVIGWSEEKELYATFSLDRILELKTIKEKEIKHTSFDANKFFADSIGIYSGSGKPLVIRLIIKQPFNRLVELSPIHSTQKVIKETKDSISIQLKVHITHELRNRILSMGPHCKVESPKALKEEIKGLINSMKKLYQV